MIQPFYASSAINRHGNYRNDKNLLKNMIIEKNGWTEDDINEIKDNVIVIINAGVVESTAGSPILGQSFDPRVKFSWSWKRINPAPPIGKHIINKNKKYSIVCLFSWNNWFRSFLFIDMKKLDAIVINK